MVPTGACGMLAMHRPANRHVMIPLPPTDETPMNLQLSIGITYNPRTWPILDGTVKPDGIDLDPDRPASVRAVLAAAALRRIRRVGNVDARR